MIRGTLSRLFFFSALVKNVSAPASVFLSRRPYIPMSRCPAKPQTEAGAETVLRAPKQKKGGVCLFLKIRRIFKNKQNRGGNVLR
jgi:hypothetical protein